MSFEQAFTPIQLGNVTLRNRFIKTATYEGMCPNSTPSPALGEHHRRIAEGGIGMTTVAYASVSKNGRTFPEQLYMRADVVPHLKDIVNRIHDEGAAASIQLGHCGYFSKNTELPGRTSLGPSRLFNAYGFFKGMFFSRAMTLADLDELEEDYANAASWAVEAGFDAVEIHLGHGYLLSQFLSPWSNKRRDEYGGNLDNRLRLPLRIIKRVRDAVGDRAILAKMNVSDGFSGGLTEDEALEVAKALDKAGVDAIITSGGFTSKAPLFLLRGERPLRDMISVEKSLAQKLALFLFGPLVMKKFPFTENFFQEMGEKIMATVSCHVALLGGIASKAGVERAMQAGFPLLVAGRALIHDPDFVKKLQAGQIEKSGCIRCNRCIAEMDRHGVRCVLPDAPGSTLPEVA